MKNILKHSFEAVSLLTTNNSMLDVTIVPAFNQPDWVIPSGLILSVDDHQAYASRYEWQQQEVAVFHLFPQNQTPEKMIVLEGNTVAHRFGLQTKGEMRQLQVRISDVKDIETPETLKNDGQQNTDDMLDEAAVLSYLYQTVVIEGNTYLVPDLDKVAHYLIEADG